MEYAKSEKEYIEEYQAKGFTTNFTAKGGILIDLDTKKEYKPEEIYIKKEFRFEGMSNPSDMSILYVIETNDHIKGTVLANYSPSSDTVMAEFFKEIPKDHFEHN
ncbi:hypothetical protein Celal_1818 [Cellulophaga algicola DSM 14237]|uniref:Phosphoribosylpyrophosphate synthetase n=1 Tax=Cellulophaga algicola (strain DSM 14237 / IC166 / ACAM 630) TaxID=688270 RepID=E6XDI7_CELAD|nr:hypothetical protein [Cellulophaga algicola]ADV49119.1 hypothetical protein Celal_1818 [Cellulophaga algicola DSM 14237]